MSTDANTGTTEALLRRISELEGNLAKANGDAKKYRLRLRDEEKAHGDLKAKHETLEAERDGLKQSPDEWKTKHDDLQKTLQARNARDAWSEVLGKDSLHAKVTVEKLWEEIGYTPGEAVPTPEEIAEQVKTARESVSYLFTDKGSTPTPAPGGATKTPAKPPLRETVGVGRGAPDTTSARVTVRKSQLRDPAWKLDPGNSKLIADASASGVLDIVDD